MDNNLENNEVSTDSVAPQRIISNERKITLINLMFRKSTDATFLTNRDGIKAFPLLTEEEKDFIDEVYKIIKALDIGEKVIGIDNATVSQLQEELYIRCQIPREVVEEMKQKRMKKIEAFNEKREEEQREWNERMAKEEKKHKRVEAIGEAPRIEVIEGGQREEIKGEVSYKKDLYQPDLLCGKSVDMPGLPFVEHISYTPERIKDVSPTTSYQFVDKTYTIKEVGMLLYMPEPNLKDTISEYEITISKGDVSKTIRRYGEISFSKMGDVSYSTGVILGLLGQTNLTDEELHGYLGSLERTKVETEEGGVRESYRLVHSPEEYTAVAIWEQIEKAKEEKNAQNKPGKEQGKVAGGEDR